MNPDLVDVKAVVGLEYDGRAYRPGEWFKARAIDALTMGQAGHVSLNREYSTKAGRPVAAAESRRARPASKPKASTYQRRDLVAEGAND